MLRKTTLLLTLVLTTLMMALPLTGYAAAAPACRQQSTANTTVTSLDSVLQQKLGSVMTQSQIQQLVSRLKDGRNYAIYINGNSYTLTKNGSDCTLTQRGTAPTATAAPTAKPTVVATQAPTPVPTVQPTAVPTATPAPTAKPTATPAPTAAPTATPVNNGQMSSLEAQMVGYINDERVAAGLPPLSYSVQLRAGAMRHSQDMSANNFFSHTSPTRGGFSARVKAEGFSYSSAGENIALYNNVEKAHVALMNSDGHRANILGKSFTHVGVAIVWNQAKGAYYITEWFARMN